MPAIFPQADGIDRQSIRTLPATSPPVESFIARNRAAAAAVEEVSPEVLLHISRGSVAETSTSAQASLPILRSSVGAVV
jgi:hypothetical protein